MILPSVRPGFWAVVEKGIYFVEFDDKYAASQFIQSSFVVGTTGSSLPIKLYGFQSRKITPIGAIEKESAETILAFPSLETVAPWPGRRLIDSNPT